MAAYGVGPDTGARILKNSVEDDEDYLIKQIIIAEKTYTLTRGFWKDQFFLIILEYGVNTKSNFPSNPGLALTPNIVIMSPSV